MKKKYKVCRILAAAGNEAGVSAILNVLRGAVPREEISVSQAFTLSQLRGKVSPYSGAEPMDILILKLPLQEDPGIEQILNMAASNSRLQTILMVRRMVRRDAYEQTAFRCRNTQIFVLSLPVQAQVLAETVRFMLAIRQGMAERDDEVMRLRKKLSEIGYITKAKCLLIQHRSMTEEEAHYYLERQAMDRCVGKKEIALEIISAAESEEK